MTSIPKTLVATDNGDAHAAHVGSWFFKGMSMLTMLVVRVKEHGVPRHGVISGPSVPDTLTLTLDTIDTLDTLTLRHSDTA